MRVNAETDIPFLQESHEARVIDKVLSIVNPRLEPSLRSFCPSSYVDCLKIALQEGIPVEEKRRKISTIMHSTIAEPLSKSMAGSIDVALVPEYLEERILSLVCRKIVDEFVEWTVGEIDERMNTRLEESRELVPPEVRDLPEEE